MSPDNLAAETEGLINRLSRSSRRFEKNVVDDETIQMIFFQWHEDAESLEQAALRLESVPEEAAAVAGIKRTLHSIKGVAGTCGLYEVAEVFHEFENLLELYLARNICPSDLILQIADWLRDFVDGIRARTPPSSEDGQPKTGNRQQGTTNSQPEAGRQKPSIRTRCSMKILIAEDDMTSRTMLHTVLTRWGYDVICVNDGEEAWTALQEPKGPSLAVLDWEMPGLDGAELCRRLRAQERKAPLYLILLTSRGEPEDIVQGLEAGADDYIAKPYNNAELKARVDVGRRMLLLQEEMQEREKFQGVLEMAGAVCHELNQPLQIVSGFSEMLMMDADAGDKNYETLKTIKGGVDRIGELTHRIMKITRYQAKPYLKGRIVDINQSSE